MPDQATQGLIRRQGRPAPSSPYPTQLQEDLPAAWPHADSGARPDSAANKAKVMQLCYIALQHIVSCLHSMRSSVKAARS